MCNFANSTKHRCQKVVGGISLLLFLFGLITTIFGLMSGGKLPEVIMKSVPKNVQAQLSGGLSTMFMAFGILILLISCLGCATAKFKNPCFAIPFGLLTLVFGLVLLIVGFLGVAARSQLKPLLQGAACKQNNPFDTQYASIVGKVVCSDICPCPNTAAKGGVGELDQWKVTNKAIKWIDFGRADTVKTMNNAQVNDYKQNGFQAKVVPFAGAAEGKPSYSTFQDCYEKVLAKNDKTAKKDNSDKAKQFIKENGFNVIKQLEDEFVCGGLCKVPLFYVTKDYKMQPTDTCINSISNKLGSGLFTAGVVSIITALISCIACCGSFPLCTKFNDDEKDE